MSTIMGGGGPPSDYVLEVVNLCHTGHVEPPTWLKQLTGTTRSGVILKDVSFEVHAGEVAAVLGSKGSGKKALLDTLASRSNGPRKGYVLLNGVTLNRRLFQSAGSYLSGPSDSHLPTGLTVSQLLHYNACMCLNIPPSLRRARIRQILADVALTQAMSTSIESLTPSERRRLAIGIQLIKDPVILLADEPTWNLDPLNTYFIISILSNYAKKYGRLVILTMEKPRSDIFPFLDRVTYLCLGDVVYTGNTRVMLEYYRAIGFPCPEVENPLMYYLCLATVDRRSHERFIESSNQVGLLVEKFRLEGGSFRTGMVEGGSVRVGSSTPLHALGKPSTLSVMGALVMRNYSTTFSFTWTAVFNIFFNLLLLPILMFVLWVFYFGAGSKYQHSYYTLNGLVLNTICTTYFGAVWSTVYTFAPHRTTYYQESRDGLYGGPVFLISYTLASLPYNLVSCLIASRIVFECTPLKSHSEWLLIYSIIFACYTTSQQLTVTVMLFLKNRILVASLLSALHSLLITCSSGTLRSLRALPEWLYYTTFIMQVRYAGLFLNEQFYSTFNDKLSGSARLPSGRPCSIELDSWIDGCRYTNGSHYLQERYYDGSGYEEKNDLGIYMNFGLVYVFLLGAVLLNLLLLLIPTPGLVKTKFRE